MLYAKIQPKYVLEEISNEELAALLRYSFYIAKDGWEQTRFSSFLTSKLMGSKIDSEKDLIKFSWEKKDDQQLPSSQATKEEIQSVRDFLNSNINK